MLTPAFDLTQDNEFLTIVIKAPYAKVSETEIFIEERDFRFHSNPYFLRLSLPGAIVEDGREKAKYDADTGHFTIRVPKAITGEHFDGLDMLTKLLAAPGNREVEQPAIEVISDNEKGEEGKPELEEPQEEDEEEFDWHVEQSPYSGDELLSTKGQMYGFANNKSGVFKRLQEELCDVIDLPEADYTPEGNRDDLRRQHQTKVFDDDHYMADFSDEDGIINTLLNYKPSWDKEYKMLLQGQDPHELVKLDEDEKEVMRKLPRKEYLLDSVTQQQVYLGLVDVLFGYAYNLRVTEGENTVESGWTICKLSGTLSWLQTFNTIKDVVLAWYRSSLCYPLYRHWQLSEKIIIDVFKILKLGRRKILKCLLETRSLLLKTDYRYILNDLYINDYCVWVQSARQAKLDSLAESLKQVDISKQEVDFDLDILEQACKLANEEANATENITSTLTSLHIHEHCISSNRGTENSTDMEKTSEKSRIASSTDSEDDEEETTESSEYSSGSETDIDSTAECVKNDIKANNASKIEHFEAKKDIKESIVDISVQNSSDRDGKKISEKEACNILEALQISPSTTYEHCMKQTENCEKQTEHFERQAERETIVKDTTSLKCKPQPFIEELKESKTNESSLPKSQDTNEKSCKSNVRDSSTLNF